MFRWFFNFTSLFDIHRCNWHTASNFFTWFLLSNLSRLSYFIHDPSFLRYAVPEQYIMSTRTPSAPSAPVATALSPVLWQVQIPTTISPNLIVMSLESSLSELICLLMLLINRWTCLIDLIWSDLPTNGEWKLLRNYSYHVLVLNTLITTHQFVLRVIKQWLSYKQFKNCRSMHRHL